MDETLVRLFWKPVEGNAVFIVMALALIVLDVVTGFTNAALKHEISSSKMREGLQHKLGSIFLILAADFVDAALLGGMNLGYDAPVLTATCIYIAVMEVMSIIENICLLNPELADNPILRLVKNKGEEMVEDAD